MNQLQVGLMPENIVLAGTISGLSLLGYSFIKQNIFCSRISIILLLISATQLYPLILEQELQLDSPLLGYKQAFFLLLGGAVLCLPAINEKNKQQPVTMAVSLVGTLSVLLAFNIICFDIEQLKPSTAIQSNSTIIE